MTFASILMRGIMAFNLHFSSIRLMTIAMTQNKSSVVELDMAHIQSKFIMMFSIFCRERFCFYDSICNQCNSLCRASRHCDMLSALREVRIGVNKLVRHFIRKLKYLCSVCLNPK